MLTVEIERATSLLMSGVWFEENRRPPLLGELSKFSQVPLRKVLRRAERKRHSRLVWLRMTGPSRGPFRYNKAALFHTLDDIPIRRLGDIQNGHTKLVLDYSNEGASWPLETINFVSSALIEKGISPRNVMILDQNSKTREIDTGLGGIRFANAHSVLAKFWNQSMSDTSGISDVPFFGHGLENAAARKYAYLCLNHKPKAARALLVARLVKRAESGLISFSKGSSKGGLKATLLEDMRKISLPDLYERNRTDVLDLLNDPEDLICDHDFGNSKFQQRKIVWNSPHDLINDCSVYIAVESEMSNPSLQRFTEKAIKASMSGLPFVVFGNYFTIGLLREMGLDVLDDIIDHKYDLIEDPAERFEAAWRETTKLISTSGELFGANTDRLVAASIANREAFHFGAVDEWLFSTVTKICEFAEVKSPMSHAPN